MAKYVEIEKVKEINGLTPCVITQSFRIDEVEPACIEVIGNIHDEEANHA